MFGHFNVNYDTRKIQYDLEAELPLVGEFLLTRQHAEQSLRYFDQTKKDNAVYSTNKMDGIRLRDIDFDELNLVIEKWEAALLDLKGLAAEIESQIGQELKKPMHVEKKAEEESMQK